MEIVDNLVMALNPGAMDPGLANPIFGILAVSAAFVAAFPGNRYLIDKGKGHALSHRSAVARGRHDRTILYEDLATSR
jgi:hypothetical protein